ncbi:phage holin family protein [Actinoplanes sp. NPDC051851]|uniref:phage holin family protein n=1 Tax=Actinoplanes sp. NPDC051851 TaxID=3154753 RepID=UPI0034423D5B
MGRDVRDALLALLPTAFALLVAAWLLDGLAIPRWWTALLIAVVLAAADALCRWSLRALSTRIGAVATLVLGILVQVALIQFALLVVPGVDTSGTAAAVATMLIVALVLTVIRWLLGVNDSGYLVADLIRRGRRLPVRDADTPGLVIVQIDGLPYPVLQFAVASGNLPTLTRWVRSREYTLQRWWARVPSTTPASQAGLLHGRNDGIPAFRWYEKDTGRLMVANRPADTAVIEERHSDGRGLLADGGVSVSNMFSGDAPTALMVMSRAQRGLGPGHSYLRFFASPFVLVRALLRTVGEMIKEVFQGRQQRLRGIEPRVDRKASYVALRGLTNVLLRDVNVAVVAEHMMAGAPVIFVDFVDYDEIAHHAGVVRPESLAALGGLDGVLATLEKVAAAATRDYRFVVLSDHGQSQGATFRQLTGRSLEEAVRAHAFVAASATLAETGTAEVWGPLNAMLTEVMARRRGAAAGVLIGPDRGKGAVPDGERPELVVVGSGNLGLVWFPRIEGRAPLETLNEHFPRLIPGLLAEPGIGFVVVESARGPLAIGPGGVHVLAEGVIEGEDPLAPFGHRAAGDLLRVSAMTHAPDVYVHSTLDRNTGEVHAFEELVGCHGGLGGWQNEAVLLHPAQWPVDPELLDEEGVLYGAETVHRQLLRWIGRKEEARGS